MLAVLPVIIESSAAQDSPCQEAASTIAALEEQVFQLEATNVALQVALSEFATDIFLTLTPAASTVSGRDYSQIPQSRTEDGAFVLGDPDAPITVVVFADFTCPHCQEYESAVNRLIDEHVVTGEVQLEFHLFPIVHPQYATLTAQIAECADQLRPGSFWAARDLIFVLSAEERYEELPRYVAKTFDLAEEAMLACAADAQQFVTDSAVARAMEVQGAPAVLIRDGDDPMAWVVRDGETYNRGGVAYSMLSDIIDEAQ